MAKRPAQNRIKQLLSIIPWILANPGRTVTEIANRFGLTKDQLFDDLSVIHMIGLPPYTPDSLVDVNIDEQARVTIRLADYFSRPLRLTPGQGLALLVSSEAIFSAGSSQTQILESALAKLRKALGVESADLVDVSLGSADSELLNEIRESLSVGQNLEIEYFSFGRDTVSTRLVTPWRLIADKGNWYLQAWCHKADAERLFRVDRIENIRPDSESETRSVTNSEVKIFKPNQEGKKVTLRLQKDALWVLESYPYENIVHNDDRTVDITLVISAVPWFERLLIKLGDSAKIVSKDASDTNELAFKAASRVLAVYQ